MSLTAEEWRVAVWNFFDPAYLFANDLTDADLDDPVIQQQLEDIFQSLENGNASFVQKALPALEIVSGRTYQLNAGAFRVRLSLLADLQRAVKRRACVLGLPELIRNTNQTRIQGRVLRTTTTGEEVSLPIQLSLETDYNDVQISADGRVMVTAGAGTRKREDYMDGTPNRRQMCEEVGIIGGATNKANAVQETYDGINIYVRQCNRNASCAGETDGFQWKLVQSLLIGATITRLHVNSDGSGIVAYAGFDNNLFIVRRAQGCGNSSQFNKWQFTQGIDLLLGDDQDVYALCQGMHASEDQSIIAVTNKNLTTGTIVGYVLTNGVGCSQTNSQYRKFTPNPTTAPEYQIVQRFTRQDIKYQRVTVSRDGSTLLLEFGPEPDQTKQYYDPQDPRINFIGMRVYHWEPNAAGVCQFKLRQTILYDGMPSEYNEQRLEYDDCITGHTQELFFAGANDNRIIRIAIRGRMERDRLLFYVYPSLDGTGYFSAQNRERLQQGNIRIQGDSEILQVFDRPAEKLDICGNAVNSCQEGIVSTGPVTVRRGEFVEFVPKPYVELRGFDIIPAIPTSLYTHQINPHVFMLVDMNARQLHVYMETEDDNVWVKVPSSKFEPFEWQSHSGGGRLKGFRGYMALMDEPGCSDRNTVCVPYNDAFVGRFVFRTIENGAGRYDGPGVQSEIGNGKYLNQNDHFVASQFGTDRPFLMPFPTTRTTGQDPKDFPSPGNPNGFTPAEIAEGKGRFTRSPPSNPQPAPTPLPGCQGVPDWPCIPFPLEFEVWQRYPEDDPRFPQCGEGFFRLSAVDPFVLIGCRDVVEFVLTPRYVDFNPANADKGLPNPNTNPEYIFSRATAPVYNTISVVCFDLLCNGPLCRADCEKLPEYYKTNTLGSLECMQRPTRLEVDCNEDGSVTLTWCQVPSANNVIYIQRAQVPPGTVPRGDPLTELSGTASPPTFTDNDTEPNTFYCYRVAACDTEGNRTVSRFECCATPPMPVTELSIDATSSTTMSISFTEPAEQGTVEYLVKLDGQVVATLSPGTDSYVFTGLTPNTEYCVVVCVQGIEPSVAAASAEVCGTTAGP